MVILIHGDDIVSSRNYFSEEKKKATQPITLQGATLTLAELMQIFSGGMLFQEEQKVFIEELFSPRKQHPELKEIIAYLAQQETHATIYLWENKDLGKKAQTLVKGAAVKSFSFPPAIFPFLDAMRPNNASLTKQLHSLLEHVDAEFVFFMIQRHIRLLLALTASPMAQPISELARMQPWQQSKLHRQAQLFGTQALRAAHHSLFSIDLAQKTGKTSLSLVQSIDMFLIRI